MSGSPQPEPYSLDKTNLSFTNTDAQSSQPVPVPNKQIGKEGLDPTSSSMAMTADISTGIDAGKPDLYKKRNELKADSKYDYEASGNLAQIPNTYGYVPSLQEVRNQDTTELLSQENTTMALAVLSGMSVFILGVMILSRGSPAPPAP
jgi:hypothetical protein